MNLETDNSSNFEQAKEPEYGAVIALGKNWKLPITGDPKIFLSLESKMTALAAAQLRKEGKVGKIIYSTGRTAGKDRFGNDYPTEAEEMNKYMRSIYSEEEVPSADVILETNSFDTAGNAEEVKKILAKKSIKNPALLTIGTHLPRSKKLFSNYDIEIKQSFSSQEILKNRNPHYKKFLANYRYKLTITRAKDMLVETIGTALVYTFDRYGNKIVRKLSRRTRNRDNE